MSRTDLNAVDIRAGEALIGICLNGATGRNGSGFDIDAYAMRLVDEINRGTGHRAVMLEEGTPSHAEAVKNSRRSRELADQNDPHLEEARRRLDIRLAPTAGVHGPDERARLDSDGSWKYDPEDFGQVAALAKLIGKFSSDKRGQRKGWWFQGACSKAFKAFKDRFDPRYPSTWIRAVKKAVKAALLGHERLDSWDHDSLALLGCFRRALGVSNHGPDGTGKSNAMPHIRLFLPVAYKGGIWELVRNLVTELVSINKDRRALRLSLMVHKDQDTSDFPDMGDFLRICRATWCEFGPDSLVWDRGVTFRPDACLDGPFFWPTTEHGETAGEGPDAIFSMVDRFVGMIAPIKPYGVWIYDMIQEWAPQGFRSESDGWFESYERITKPNIRQASVVVVPSRCVADDVQSAYRVPPSMIRTIPVACEPGKRFGTVHSERVGEVNAPYFLYPANAAPHKGADVVVKAIMAAKRSHPGFPMLVQCGFNSESFSMSFNGQGSRHAVSMRKLLARSGLKEGTDIRFLGFLPDQQLKWLFENAIGVINAARFDNGSFSLIEADWFGCPIISTDYPGVRELAGRFALPVRFVPMDDPDALAAELTQVWRERKANRLVGNHQDRTGQQTEHSARTQAEEFYEVLREFGIKSQTTKIPPH